MAMTAYRLHYFPESGNSYKLALMLTLCGQTFEPVWTDFFYAAMPLIGLSGYLRGTICRNCLFQQVARMISSLHRFASVRDPFASLRNPLHFDNTFLKNDDPQLSCLA